MTYDIYTQDFAFNNKASNGPVTVTCHVSFSIIQYIRCFNFDILNFVPSFVDSGGCRIGSISKNLSVDFLGKLVPDSDPVELGITPGSGRRQASHVRRPA